MKLITCITKVLDDSKYLNAGDQVKEEGFQEFFEMGQKNEAV